MNPNYIKDLPTFLHAFAVSPRVPGIEGRTRRTRSKVVPKQCRHWDTLQASSTGSSLDIQISFLWLMQGTIRQFHKQLLTTNVKFLQLAIYLIMRAKIRLPKQLPSRTLAKSVLPTDEHALRLLVPAFTDVQLLHFNAKWASHPLSASPRRITATAVLVKTTQQLNAINFGTFCNNLWTQLHDIHWYPSTLTPVIKIWITFLEQVQASYAKPAEVVRSIGFWWSGPPSI